MGKSVEIVHRPVRKPPHKQGGIIRGGSATGFPWIDTHESIWNNDYIAGLTGTPERKFIIPGKTKSLSGIKADFVFVDEIAQLEGRKWEKEQTQHFLDVQ